MYNNNRDFHLLHI